MNAFFFATKRAFHGTLRVVRRPLRCFGLTSARFDLMYALLPWADDSMCFRQTQAELARTLGVTPSVVSRMVCSLEALGFVEREWSPTDRRSKEVSLTELGKGRVRMAFQALRRACERVVDMALGRERFRDKLHALLRRDELDDCLQGICDFCDDHAWLPYYWHPEDLIGAAATRQ